MSTEVRTILGRKPLVPLDPGDRIGTVAITVKLSAIISPRIDWAAYVAFAEWSDEDAARRGDKLPERVARFFFPGIEEPYRE